MTQAPRKTRWQRFRRLAIRGFGVCLATIAIALGTLPYWVGFTLRSLMPKDVVTVGAYETLGYGRFKLSDIQVNSGNVILKMDRLEAPSPLNWAYRATTSGFEPFVVEIGSLAVQILETENDDTVAKSDAPKMYSKRWSCWKRHLG